MALSFRFAKLSHLKSRTSHLHSSTPTMSSLGRSIAADDDDDDSDNDGIRDLIELFAEEEKKEKEVITILSSDSDSDSDSNDVQYRRVRQEQRQKQIEMIQKMTGIRFENIVSNSAWSAFSGLEFQDIASLNIQSEKHIVTYGVIFKIEKTQITKENKSFAKVILGTLDHGPKLDVLIFDGCYTQIKSLPYSAVVGKVVALTKPVFSRSKSKSSDQRTTVFCFNASQFTIIADAGDFGLCPFLVKFGLLDLGEACSTKCDKPFDMRNGRYCPECQQATLSQKTTRPRVSRAPTYRPPPRQVPASLNDALATTRLGEQELRWFYCQPNQRLEKNSLLNPSNKKQKTRLYK
jgi:hypothetical protein